MTERSESYISRVFLARCPFIPPLARRACPVVLASSRAPSASASLRLILPFTNARRVNSPASAALAPARSTEQSTCSVTSTPPWQYISTVFSPVNEYGARNTAAIPSSISCLSEKSTMRPLTIFAVGASLSGFSETRKKTRSATAIASSPDILIIATPPLPLGVETAAIVSFKFIFPLFSYFSFKKEKVAKENCKKFIHFFFGLLKKKAKENFYFSFKKEKVAKENCKEFIHFFFGLLKKKAKENCKEYNQGI